MKIRFALSEEKAKKVEYVVQYIQRMEKKEQAFDSIDGANAFA